MAAEGFGLESAIASLEKAYLSALDKTKVLKRNLTQIETALSYHETKPVAELFAALETVSTKNTQALQVEEEHKNQLSFHGNRTISLLREFEETLNSTFYDMDDS